jgi:ribose 5-phosphate isomerase B
MTIYLGADHRGFELKKQIQKYLDNQKIPYEDFGALTYDPDDDYNEPAVAVSEVVLKNPADLGILICGSAVGITIQANRFKGIRAACCWSPALARIARQHNDANILCLSADFDPKDFIPIIDAFITTAFLPEDRYIRRNQKLDEDT